MHSRSTRPSPASHPTVRPPPYACAPGILVAACIALLLAGDAAAFNVGTFTSATIRRLAQFPPGPPGTDPIPLDIDPNNPPNDATTFSIPRGSIVEITIKGTVAAAGQVGLDLMDDDIHEAGRGFDDILDEGMTPLPLQAGDPFEIVLHCDCNSQYEISGEENSGEQSAEVYVRDGEKRIPMDQNVAGGGKKQFWWTFDCDKDTVRNVSISGTSINTAWGDHLLIPPGALTSPQIVRVANMYPLLHTDAVPVGYLPISEAVTIEPNGLALNLPAILNFEYTDEEAGETADENTLAVFRYEPATTQWLPMPGAIGDPGLNRISLPIPQFGTYGFAAREPAQTTASQRVQTGVGNSHLGLPDFANGSELDGATATVQNGALWLHFTGNLASDFSKLDLFIDCLPGGQNRLRGDNPIVDSNGLNRMGDGGGGDGLRFDAGFEADFWIGLGGGDVGGGSYRLVAHYAELLTGGGGTGFYLGQATAARNGVLAGGANPFGIRATIDNSNVDGIGPGCGPDVGDGVTTGVLLAIPLAALGNPTGCLSVCAFINGSAHDIVSNQVLGSLDPGTCSLGEPRLVNFAGLPGNQFLSVCQGVLAVGPRPDVTRPRVTASPNPFRREVSLRVERPPGDLHAEVFDVSGRKIRRLASTAFASGAATWDGRGDDGRPAPPGIYLVRVSGAGLSESVRLLKLR